eukprot:5765726-Pleurochrysis_carterae.AAC.2
MASPPSEQASELFTGGAAQAATTLLRATRAAKRTLLATRGTTDNAQLKPLNFLSLNSSAWKRNGILSAFRMMGGPVLFTMGRDVVRKADVDGRRQLMVQLMKTTDGDPMPLPVERLLLESDGVLAGVLSYDHTAEGCSGPTLARDTH